MTRLSFAGAGCCVAPFAACACVDFAGAFAFSFRCHPDGGRCLPDEGSALASAVVLASRRHSEARCWPKNLSSAFPASSIQLTIRRGSAFRGVRSPGQRGICTFFLGFQRAFEPSPGGPESPAAQLTCIETGPAHFDNSIIPCVYCIVKDRSCRIGPRNQNTSGDPAHQFL